MVEVMSSAGEGSGRPGLVAGSKDMFINDGRTTPTPESESANYLSRNSSFPSATSQSAPNEPTTGGTPLFVPKAEVGLGPLSGEEQLKTSLQAKDRIFLLVLAKEIEAFIAKVAAGEEPNIIPSIPLATNSTSVLASMSASFAVASHISSTFQRMLVYKLAEWYGLKAVHTTEVAMLVGVLGTLEPRSASLRLSDLAPRADTPPQQFRIMQRTQPPSSAASSDANGVSRASSTVPDDAASEASSSRVKTLQEREAAYNKARERIYGGQDSGTGEEPQDHMGTIRQKRSVQDELDDDFETAPRPGLVTTDQLFQQPIYPSMYDPPKVQAPVAGPSGVQYNHGNPYQHDPSYGAMPQQMPMHMTNYMGDYQQAQYAAQYPQGVPQYGMPPYMPPQQYPNQQPMGYPGQWCPQQSAYGRQMPPNQVMQQQQQPGWAPPQQGPVPNQPMPMIPQGMQYPGVYGYPAQQQHHQQQQHQPQQNYPPLMQPTPMRPAVHPHSSASSSISSRSYQSYHDGSRPHSRGSTTSNMSATSSVRFGAMYPANQGPGYRQKGLKGQGVNGLAGLTLPNDGRRNHTRPHSPSSATTESSRSSRHTGSINVVAPSQHPLPQRPDWAANNVPYQISQGGTTSSPSTSEFPPLARHGTGTHAEPMQVERVKARSNGSGSLPGSVWTSPNSPAASASAGAGVGASEFSPTSPRSRMMRTPGPLVPSPKTPAVVPPATATSLSGTAGPEPGNATEESIKPSDEDDFPRRVPLANSSQILFDPSAPAATSAGPRSEAHSPAHDFAGTAMTADDVIEAKLAAISLREGVTIGPPPAKQNGQNGPAPSYARIVKRD